MTKRTRVALVGLGRMGRVHADNLAHHCAGAELACVVDANAEAAREVGERLGASWGTSVDDVLADDSVPAVVIATPTGTHAPLIRQAAAAGKQIFCEKPVSLDRAATLDALAAVESAGVLLQVGFHRRFDPDWVAVYSRIVAGDLGRPYLFRTSLRDMTAPPARFLAGSGGFFVDVTIHDLDVARWLVGEVVQVSAHGAALSDPEIAEVGDLDTTVVVLHFENGALGVIDGSRSAGYGYECSTEIMGSLATARVDDPRRHHYEWRTPGWAGYELPTNFEERYPFAYVRELEAFLACVRTGTPAAVTGRDALAAFDLAVAADKAWRSGLPVSLRPHRDELGVLYETVGEPAPGP